MAYKKYDDVTAVLVENKDVAIVRAYQFAYEPYMISLLVQEVHGINQKSQVSIIMTPEKARELAAALNHHAKVAEQLSKEK